MQRLRAFSATACVGLVGALGAASLVGIERARAAEGASSHYLPGVAGDLGFALPPKPGLQLGNTLWIQSGDVDRAVLQGRVNAELDVDIILDLVAATYTFSDKVLGGSYTVGAMIPFGYANLEASLTGPLGNTVSASADSFNLSDIVLIPFQMNWSVGNFHFKLAESIIAPTGGYDVDKNVNLGRNYWSFDTAGAFTWMNTDTGTEVSFAPGIMVNTKNNETDYRTGTEFHLDFVANQFLAPTFAIGIRGYYYDQLSGDSGSGARLGDFKSESLGIGPGFVWTPAFAGGKLAIAGKWIHDVHSENRFDSDYGLLTVGWKF